MVVSSFLLVWRIASCSCMCLLKLIIFLCPITIRQNYFLVSDVYWTVHQCDSWRIKNQLDVTCYIYFLDTQHVSGINMSILGSLWLCCWSTTLAVLFLDCCVLELGCSSAGVVSRLPAEAASAGSLDTTPAELHPNSNTQQSKNNTANVVDQQHSHKLPRMDILMPETCWVSKK